MTSTTCSSCEKLTREVSMKRLILLKLSEKINCLKDEYSQFSKLLESRSEVSSSVISDFETSKEILNSFGAGSELVDKYICSEKKLLPIFFTRKNQKCTSFFLDEVLKWLKKGVSSLKKNGCTFKKSSVEYQVLHFLIEKFPSLYDTDLENYLRKRNQRSKSS